MAAISGRSLTVAAANAYPAGYFSGGMVKAPDGSYSYVTEHSGSTLTMNRISSSIASAFADTGTNTDVTLYPGCPHDYVTCRDRFSNDDNYGGFDYIPDRNPMGGSSIV